jgi:hypothetical protein
MREEIVEREPAPGRRRARVFVLGDSLARKCDRCILVLVTVRSREKGGMAYIGP